MLNGKIAMITGAGSGIGRQIALTMAKHNAKIIACDLVLSLAEETADIIKNMGVDVLPLKCNIANYEEVEISVNKAIEHFNHIDVLVNNAAIFKESDTFSKTNDLWDMHLDVNLTGTYNCIKAVAPYMIKQNNGSIINITTVDAFQGCKGYTPYCATKAGVVGLTKNFALELADYGIRVNSVAPGIIETNMSRDRIIKYMDSYLAKIPLKRIGKPEDIANSVTFLASDMSDYITGQILHVNGGMRFN